MYNTVLLIAALMLVPVTSVLGQAKVVALKPREFKALLERTEQSVLLDVRTPKETKAESIPGAVFADYKSDDFEAQLERMDKNRPYFVYCLSGVRSANAADLMQKLGFKKLYTLSGGIEAWKEAGFEVMKNKPKQ